MQGISTGGRMQVINSSIQLAGEHSLTRQSSTREALRAWVGGSPPDATASRSEDDAPAASTRVTLSSASREAAVAAAKAEAQSEAEKSSAGPAEGKAAEGSDAAGEIENAMDEVRNDPGMRALISVVETLTDRKVELLSPEAVAKMDAAREASESADTPPEEAAETSEASQGWGVEYERHTRVHEAEQTDFSARGVINTADGRSLDFSLDLQMQRSFTQQTDTYFAAGDGEQVDPLVINLDGNAADLVGQKMAFDLDADGEEDNISVVDAGSGFLALDRNGNGRIDDGSELFGPQSGDGFADLAAHDEDGNGWIDEQDPVFARLRIWRQDASGDMHQETLAENGVGALGLDNAATPFELNDSNYQQDGQIRSSGVYLKENGAVDTLQHVDLTV